uniref:Transmembrane protein n=1 Tax=Brassica campestris TaxID=3711 RepID=M4FCF4_BRACM
MESISEGSSSNLMVLLFGIASVVLVLSSNNVNGLRDLKERDGSESRSMSGTTSSSVLDSKNFYTNVSTAGFENDLVGENCHANKSRKCEGGGGGGGGGGIRKQ